MFVVERVPTFEYYCPNGHALPELNQNRRASFCPTCGQRLEEKQVLCDVPFCSNCRSQVDPGWNYCPYCDHLNKKEGGNLEQVARIFEDLHTLAHMWTQYCSDHYQVTFEEFLEKNAPTRSQRLYKIFCFTRDLMERDLMERR